MREFCFSICKLQSINDKEYEECLKILVTTSSIEIAILVEQCKDTEKLTDLEYEIFRAIEKCLSDRSKK